MKLITAYSRYGMRFAFLADETCTAGDLIKACNGISLHDDGNVHGFKMSEITPDIKNHRDYNVLVEGVLTPDTKNNPNWIWH